ncbi:hypothetical protein HG530_005866 [Fusarium avenaceum]|uniref:Global transcription regulator sge1 n=1 Tax=Fusarium avenaceum TaxID=40199 RepID=A0A9P7L0J5_9HYPO|nr:hypothetical protein KAF25_009751 [Fusarium avenaceum]KAI6767857.1 hypothetical protein HG530_005866 [Fusarium avenaceum]KIL95831.1 hypothetical protein FAVG1_00569 [Fusarium avenaceum]
MSSSTPPLQPTYHGFINTTLDASIIFENTFTGRCNHVPRRPHDRERQDLIKSGNVFIYEEHASGIKRWTDSLSWSPSRILGNFLIYRELERPFPPGEKKRALKKGKKPSSTGINKPQDQHPRTSTSLPTGMEVRRNNTPIDEIERSLVGSLVDSYDFKPGGLIKKTISITYQGVPHHLVSYYSVEDVRSGRLLAPSMHPVLKGTIPRTELLTQQNFRSPIENSDQFYSLHGNVNGHFHSQGPIHGHDQRLSLYQQHMNSSPDYAIGSYNNLPPPSRSLSMANPTGHYPIVQPPYVPANFSPYSQPPPPQPTQTSHMQNWGVEYEVEDPNRSANNYYYETEMQ